MIVIEKMLIIKNETYIVQNERKKRIVNDSDAGNV